MPTPSQKKKRPPQEAAAAGRAASLSKRQSTIAHADRGLHDADQHADRHDEEPYYDGDPDEGFGGRRFDAHDGYGGGLYPAYPPPPPPAKPVYVIGRSMFETSGVPSDWPHACKKHVDEVWLPSEFNRDTFAAHGVERRKLRVVPEPIDLGLFRPEGTPPMELPLRPPASTGRRAFAFLSVFKFEQRKGWDVLLRAFLAEFNAADDDVVLYLRVSTDGHDKAKLARWISRELCACAAAAATAASEPARDDAWSPRTRNAS